MLQVIVEESMNSTPADSVNARLAKLGDGWKVVSASTALYPVGSHNTFGIEQPLHVCYVTTVVVTDD